MEEFSGRRAQHGRAGRLLLPGPDWAADVRDERRRKIRGPWQEYFRRLLAHEVTAPADGDWRREIFDNERGRCR